MRVSLQCSSQSLPSLRAGLLLVDLVAALLACMHATVPAPARGEPQDREPATRHATACATVQVYDIVQLSSIAVVPVGSGPWYCWLRVSAWPRSHGFMAPAWSWYSWYLSALCAGMALIASASSSILAPAYIHGLVVRVRLVSPPLRAASSGGSWPRYGLLRVSA